MKAFYVVEECVLNGIEVTYSEVDGYGEGSPKIVVGEGGPKPAEFALFAVQDISEVVCVEPRTNKRVQKDISVPKGDDAYHIIYDVGVVAYPEKYVGSFYVTQLLCKPIERDKNLALVFWEVPWGYMGDAEIRYNADVNVLVSGHSFCGCEEGEIGIRTAQVLAVLEPGQELRAKRYGANVYEKYGYLRWTGDAVEVCFFGENGPKILNGLN